jgi:integrase
MTWVEIERIIGRGGLTEGQEDQLWKCLFLDRDQIDEVLRHVKANARQPFIYPMFVFVAHTGVRRSEMLRSQIDDFDFQSRNLLVREKKKSRTSAVTYRRIPMTDLLVEVMHEWFAIHPGGQQAICQCSTTTRGKRPGRPISLTRSVAHDHFKRTLEDSPWERIRGFHVFRHSFASNLAAAGIDQRIIDEWMGHQTDEMRRRYRHLFPDQQRKAIDSVFGGNGK